MQSLTADPIVFSAAWFARHQRVLLGLLNAPVIGRWFRWVLCIRQHDVGYRQRIVRIAPNHYAVRNDDGSFTVDFRTHAKYAKRLHYVLWPLWAALHAWDAWVANPLVPALNVGFDTLTVYPDANPGTTSTDGSVIRGAANETWAALIAGAGSSASTANSSDNLAHWADFTGVAGNWDVLYRTIVLFDTSSLGVADVSAATVSIYGQNKSDNAGLTPEGTFDIYTATPASNTAVVAADYTQIGTTSQTGSPIGYSAWTTAGYNVWTLNATGRSNIAKTGITKFGIRNANYDVAATAPTWVAFQQHGIAGYFADQTGSANDPKLVVTYSIPGLLLVKN